MQVYTHYMQYLNWIKGGGGAEILLTVYNKITEDLFYFLYSLHQERQNRGGGGGTGWDGPLQNFK